MPADLAPGMIAAPSDGRCFHCKGDIVAALGDEYARRGITGCPICCYSYCE